MITANSVITRSLVQNNQPKSMASPHRPDPPLETYVKITVYRYGNKKPDEYSMHLPPVSKEWDKLSPSGFESSDSAVDYADAVLRPVLNSFQLGKASKEKFECVGCGGKVGDFVCALDFPHARMEDGRLIVSIERHVWHYCSKTADGPCRKVVRQLQKAKEEEIRRSRRSEDGSTDESLTQQKISYRCSNCDRRTEDLGDLKRCSRCKIAYYCSAECQREAWSWHKKNCVPEEKGTTATEKQKDKKKNAK